MKCIYLLACISIYPYPHVCPFSLFTRIYTPPHKLLHSTPHPLLTHTRQQATTSLAASLNLPLNIHFTDPGQPLFIEIETDDLDEPDYPQDEDGEDVDVDDGSSRIWECFFALATVRIEGEDEDEDVGAEAGAG